MSGLDEIRERADQVCPARHVSDRAEDTWILCREDVPRLLAVAEAAQRLLKMNPGAFIGWEPRPETHRKIDKRFAKLHAALDALDTGHGAAVTTKEVRSA